MENNGMKLTPDFCYHLRYIGRHVGDGPLAKYALEKQLDTSNALSNHHIAPTYRDYEVAAEALHVEADFLNRSGEMSTEQRKDISSRAMKLAKDMENNGMKLTRDFCYHLRGFV